MQTTKKQPQTTNREEAISVNKFLETSNKQGSKECIFFLSTLIKRCGKMLITSIIHMCKRKINEPKAENHLNWKT